MKDTKQRPKAEIYIKELGWFSRSSFLLVTLGTTPRPIGEILKEMKITRNKLGCLIWHMRKKGHGILCHTPRKDAEIVGVTQKTTALSLSAETFEKSWATWK